ncbi:MAG TPA: uroporphyrinogen-III synthase [Candidatus Dormibacteraeota bacterium]|jgi:uroporphyrinogen-III synthase
MIAVDLPLAGRRIVVTRTREQAAGVVDRLHALGATVVVVPLISTVPIATPDEIVRGAAELRSAPEPRWVAFTSATAVRLVVGAAGAEALAGSQVAGVGPATARVLEEAGRAPDLVAADRDAAGLVAAMALRGMAGSTVWFPAAEGASERLAGSLRELGATVTVQHIYRSVMPDAAPERLRAAIDDGVDAITLTSGSTARHLGWILGAGSLPADISIVCIGDQTASEARAIGLSVHAVATVASAEGLAEAVRECLTAQQLR